MFAVKFNSPMDAGVEAKSLLISNLIVLADTYCAKAQQSRASVAKAIFGRGGHLDDLASGRRDLATGTFEKAVQWFSANWPGDACWPATIRRPAPVREAAE